MKPALTITPGVCCGCGCTDDNACFDDQAEQGCHWVNADQTWCSVCAIGWALGLLAAGEELRRQDHPILVAA